MGQTRVVALDSDARERFYTSLSALLDAEVPLARALHGADTAAPATAAVDAVARRVEKGTTLARAMRAAHFAGERDLVVIATAEEAGALAPSLRSLAALYAAAATRARRMRSRLWMPGAVLVIGVMVQPLPGLVGGDVDMAGYLRVTVVPLLILGGCVWMLARALRGGASDGIVALLRVVPLAGRLWRRAAIASLLETIVSLLRAGLPALDAMQVAARAAPDRSSRDACLRARREMERGAGVAAALRSAGILDARFGAPLVESGEQAGRLDESLGRFAASWRQSLDDDLDQTAQWIPRVVYVLVLVVLGAGYLG